MSAALTGLMDLRSQLAIELIEYFKRLADWSDGRHQGPSDPLSRLPSSVFVEPEVEVVHADHPTEPAPAQRVPWHAERKRLGVDRPRRAVIIGPPGSGKTRLMRSSASALAREAGDMLDRRAGIQKIPLVMVATASALTKRAIGDGKLPDAAVRAAVAARALELGCGARATAYLAEHVHESRSWLFLDDLDRCAADQRDTLQAFLDVVGHDAWQCRVVLASSGLTLPMSCVTYAIAPFSRAQVQVFVEKRFESEEPRRRTYELLASAGAREPRPFLLSLLCAMAGERGAGAPRPELCQELVEFMKVDPVQSRAGRLALLDVSIGGRRGEPPRPDRYPAALIGVPAGGRRVCAIAYPRTVDSLHAGPRTVAVNATRSEIDPVSLARSRASVSKVLFGQGSPIFLILTLLHSRPWRLLSDRPRSAWVHWVVVALLCACPALFAAMFWTPSAGLVHALARTLVVGVPLVVLSVAGTLAWAGIAGRGWSRELNANHLALFVDEESHRSEGISFSLSVCLGILLAIHERRMDGEGPRTLWSRLCYRLGDAVHRSWASATPTSSDGVYFGDRFTRPVGGSLHLSSALLVLSGAHMQGWRVLLLTLVLLVAGMTPFLGGVAFPSPVSLPNPGARLISLQLPGKGDTLIVDVQTDDPDELFVRVNSAYWSNREAMVQGGQAVCYLRPCAMIALARSARTDLDDLHAGYVEVFRRHRLLGREFPETVLYRDALWRLSR